MHRRPFDKDHGGLWEFPGGKVDPGEDCRAALVREIAEETTLSICADDLVETGFAVSSPGLADQAIVLLLYKTSLWEGELASPEGGTFAWLDREEIARLDMAALDVILARQLFAGDLRGVDAMG